MVYTNRIKEGGHVLDAVAPPFVAVLLHFLPIIEGVAPELSVGAEIIG